MEIGLENLYVDVVVNCFLLFLAMVMFANEVLETKEK